MNTNSVTLVGNLVDAPEVQVTASGAVRTRVRVAHTERRRDPSTDTWSDGESLFLDVVAWRRMGENTGNSLQKGDRVIVVGRLRQWTAERDGNRRTVVEIEAESIGPDLQRGVVTVARPRRPVPVGGGSEVGLEIGSEGDSGFAGAGPDVTTVPGFEGGEPLDGEPGWVSPLVAVADPEH